jgi:branched-chain amino acid transport system permease protein
MAGILQTFISGLVLGSIYATMAMGLTLIYGGLRMLNLAQGALFMLGGYAGWWASAQLGLNPFVGFLAAFVAMGLIGVGMQVFVVRPLIRRPGWEINTIVATLGLGILLENVALVVFGPEYKNLPLLIGGQVRLPYNVIVSDETILIAVIAVALLVAMALFLRRSRHGMAIRAIAQNMDAARLMGISVERMFIVIMGLSAALGGLAGVLLSAFYFVSPTIGDTYLLKGLIVTIFGGLGSVKGTIYAAYAVGLLEAFVSLGFGVRWSLPAFFLAIIVVLVVRPAGLFGLREEVRL